MSDHIYLLQELLRHYNRKRIFPWCLSKIDLKKVLYSVSWPFLQATLTGLDFPLVFVAWYHGMCHLNHILYIG